MVYRPLIGLQYATSPRKGEVDRLIGLSAGVNRLIGSDSRKPNLREHNIIYMCVIKCFWSVPLTD